MRIAWTPSGAWMQPDGPHGLLSCLRGGEKRGSLPARAVPGLMVAALLCGPAAADERTLSSYAPLPDSVVRLLDADPFPDTTLDPSGRYMLEVYRHGLLSLESLSEPLLTVAGVPINPVVRSLHAPRPYFGLTLIDVASATSRSVPVPPTGNIGFPVWSPDGSRYAFTVTTDTGVELWIGTTGGLPPRRLTGPILNAARSAPCTWMADGGQMLCRVALDDDDSEPLDAALLSQSTHPGGRFYPRHDSGTEEQLVVRYLTAQLELIDIRSGVREPIGRPAVVESVEPSPDGEYLLIVQTVPPYSRRVPSDHAPRVVEVWNRSGEPVHTLAVQLQGGESIAPRAPHWHASQPATLVWVEPKAGGDRVMARSAPFEMPATELFQTPENRFSGLSWLQDSDRGLVSEYDAISRVTRVWLIDPRAANEPRLLGSRSVDRASPGLGRPLTTHNGAGKTVVRVHDNRIYLRGRENVAEGRRSYLDQVDLDTLQATRHWQSVSDGYETVIDVVSADAGLLLTQHQSAREPPNYRVLDVQAGTSRPLTGHTHPAPQLQDARRFSLHYERADGLELSSTLYVPADHELGERLPLVVWAYPREYRADGAPVALDAPDRFLDFERAFKLFFLLSGYAVMDDVSMPIVGDVDQANDTFIEQIIANARAAIDAAEATGVVDARRVAVAGHSYGAFMVANLLAHSRLFQAGAALSGAYNRTLTPFGFQTERRTLWEARDTYLQISPFFFSDQIEAPLLLVHGLRDDNAGTSPMQSQYMYEAIRRHGGEAELLLLPLEGHSYRARESVLETAQSMLRWFDIHVKGREQLPADDRQYLTDHVVTLDARQEP